jgi:hypothetical protein
MFGKDYFWLESEILFKLAKKYSGSELKENFKFGETESDLYGNPVSRKVTIS